MEDMIYFDNSATTKPHREVISEVMDCMENIYGNPSSAHGLGLLAEKKLKTAREQVGKLINAMPQEIIFTSGGSEANNTAIKGCLRSGDHYITTEIEHPSVLNLNEILKRNGIEVTILKVDSNGLINLNELKTSIKDNTRLVSIMYVNNEIGVIEPIKEIVEIIRTASSRIKIHVDGVQALGKLMIDVKTINIDLLSMSAHKIHGPKGVGALYIKKGTDLKPLIDGGGQENGLRSGTENVPAIAGFGLAAAIAKSNLVENNNKIETLKNYFIERLSEIEGVNINSPMDSYHVANILNISFGDVRGEVLLHALEDYKIYVSTGSACSSKGGGHKNYVLPAIGLADNMINGTLRFSFSCYNNIGEVDITIDALKKILPFLRRLKK